LVLARLVQVAFDHGNRHGRMLGDSFGGEAHEVGQISACQSAFERGERWGEQGGVGECHKFGWGGRMDGSETVMEKVGGTGGGDAVGGLCGNEIEMPKASGRSAGSGKYRFVVEMNLDGSSIERDSATSIAQLPHRQ
jgi:hypothetical protein